MDSYIGGIGLYLVVEFQITARGRIIDNHLRTFRDESSHVYSVVYKCDGEEKLKTENEELYKRGDGSVRSVLLRFYSQEW